MIAASSILRLRCVGLRAVRARPVRRTLPDRVTASKIAAVSESSADISTMVATANAPYDDLCSRLREISSLEAMGQLLEWDEMVMMPEGSATLRGEHKAALAGVTHEKSTDATLGKLLSELVGDSSLDDVQKCVVREAKRSYDKDTKLSKELSQRKKKLESEAYEAWAKARQAKEYSIFAPKFKEIIELEREIAATVDPDKGAYTSAMDRFEKGMTADRIEEIFSELKMKLLPLIAAVRESPTPPDSAWLEGDYDVKTQASFCDELCKELGFDTTVGRLDVSVHPFTCGFGPSDVRMTTRFKPHDWTEGLTGAVHECGHALYEQGRNTTPEFSGLPIANALSLGMHESQSLFWERMVALCPAFSKFLLPKLQAAFPGFGEGKSASDLYEAINKMKDPSMIRVEADELTYPMHVILRYEIERALVDGKMEVEEVPEVWTAKMQEYLGVTPKDDAEGCLQDMHWSMGAVGYFPTYTLGAAIAVQLQRQIEEDLPTMHEDIASGNFSPIREWLRKKVHEKGSIPTCSDELLEAVTGEPLNVNYFVDYLTKKFSALYKL